MKILVIEDEAIVAELLQESLEELGNSCVLAGDADDADRLLDQHAVDAVTLDLGIPGVSSEDLEEILLLEHIFRDGGVAAMIPGGLKVR